MKLFPMRYIILFILIATHTDSLAQPELRKVSISPVTQNYFGTTVDASCKFYYPRNKFSVGLGYLINPPTKGTFPNAVFVNKAYATNFLEHFVFKAGHEVDIFSRYEGKVRLFLFTQLSVLKTSLKEETYSGAISNNTYEEGPIYIYETNGVDKNVKAIFLTLATGAGFEVPFTDKISIEAKGGISSSIDMIRYGSGRHSPSPTIFGNHMFYSFSVNYEL